MALQVETQNILSNLIAALSIEIDSIKKYVQNITAKNGSLLENIGELFIYKFELNDSYDIPDDTQVLIRTEFKSNQAIIINCKGLEIIISCEVDLGKQIPSITILVSNSNLLESLKRLLEEIQSEKILINENLVLKLFGNFPANQTPFPEYFIPPLPFELDEYQKSVIQKSLDSDVSFIWGPPGTGKTAVIAILTKIIIESGLTVLITSNTNIAVDNAFEKFIQFFRDTSGHLTNGQVIRYGNIQVENIKDLVQESFILTRKAKPLYDKIRNIKGHIKSLTEKKTDLVSSIENFQDYENLKKLYGNNILLLSSTNKKLVSHNKELEDTSNNMLYLSDEIYNLEKLLIISKKTNFLIRILKGIKSPKNISSLLSHNNSSLYKLSITKNGLINYIKAANNEKDLLNKNIAEVSSKVTDIEDRNPSFKTSSISSIKHQIQVITEEIDQLNEEISSIEKEIKLIEESILNEAKVIGTTLSMFHSKSNLYTRTYDIVIIDEVSMAILPQIFFASAFAKSKVIIVGDFYQLQSIVKTTQNDLVREWIKQDIFRKNKIEDGSNSKLLKLCVQRRMSPSIAEISNKSLYNNILLHSPQHEELIDECPVSFYNTASFSPYATIPGSTGRINVYNAVLAIKLAKTYYDHDKVDSVGIITPYRKQANLLSKLISDLKISNKVIADTVHKFQGLEKDVIIFDIPDGINTKGYGIGKNLKDFREAPYLFNVAFTRAKKKLIVIGDLSYLRNNSAQLPHKVQEMLKIITHSDDGNYEIVDSTTVLDAMTITEDSNITLSLTQSNDILHFSEQSFYADFLNELINCQNSLTIYSPFIAHNRVINTFSSTFFNSLLNGKVKVNIYTKPLCEHSQASRNFAQNCINDWRNMGIKVIEREKMHEKVAIIDNRIIYVGSLNILSQWQSRETMLKLTGSNAIKELIKVYNS